MGMRTFVQNNKAFVFLALFILLVLVYTYFRQRQYDSQFSGGKSEVITATITNVIYNQTATLIKVSYSYKGRTIQNAFDTYDTDSLYRNLKVRILVQKHYPDGGIKFIGVGENIHSVSR